MLPADAISRIHLSGELLEVDLLQRTYGNDDQNVAVAQQLKAEHWFST